MSSTLIRIKELREERHMTKAAFAALIGVNQQRVYEIESSKVAPSDKAIMGIIEKLGVNMDWLMRGVGEKYAKTDAVKEPTAGYGAGILERIDSRDEAIESKLNTLLTENKTLTGLIKQLYEKVEQLERQVAA